jgi:hypothetical protein
MALNASLQNIAEPFWRLFYKKSILEMEYLYKPHFYAHILASVSLVVALVLLIFNYKKVLRLDGIEIAKIFSVLAIAIAAHGQGHTTLEKEFGYDPLAAFK